MEPLPPNPKVQTVLDPDLAALLPATATPTERIYAVAVQDARDGNEMRLQADLDRAALSLAETKRHNLACEANGASAAASTARHADLLAEDLAQSFSPPNRLFIDCVKLGVEMRRQSMTTTTGRDTVMQDVVKDGTWIGYQVYNRIATELGLPARTIPVDL